MNTIRLALPILVLVLTVINFFTAMHNGNDAAMWANFTAFMGWVIVTIDAYQTNKRFA